ncbi:hypothetical protein ACJX0J_033093 [Zea mays]
MPKKEKCHIMFGNSIWTNIRAVPNTSTRILHEQLIRFIKRSGHELLTHLLFHMQILTFALDARALFANNTTNSDIERRDLQAYNKNNHRASEDEIYEHTLFLLCNLIVIILHDGISINLTNLIQILNYKEFLDLAPFYFPSRHLHIQKLYLKI